ncbi:hypothetical protein [Sphingosinicella terrae]|uniref:hypothetical protein n=1 Tax=Sphingosinicella terrae TaxID=2172047 RepID=UPI000E0CFFBA|nr:hypothetical protein [Sphingosinicella terrae]
MRVRPLLLSLAITGTLALPASVQAQRRGEVMLFSQNGFRGQTFIVSGTRPTLPIPWTVRSVRVAPGEAWDLCTRTGFRAPCNRVAIDTASVSWRVASARPSQVVTLPEPVPPVGGGGGSLRGMSAEFFTQPSDGRGRVISCASGAAACAADSANRFCRSRGWTAASYHRQETVGGRNFLADVLCTRTGA